MATGFMDMCGDCVWVCEGVIIQFEFKLKFKETL